MATELRHIERISDTQANLRSNLDPKQCAIEGGEALGSRFFVYDDADGNYHTCAVQHYYDGSLNYVDNEFGNVTLHGALYVDEYVYHAGDTDTYFRLQSDQLSLVCGGTTIVTAVEGGTDYFQINVDGRMVEYLYHAADLDTYIRYQDDQVTIACGGATMIDCSEGTADQITLTGAIINSGFTDYSTDADITVDLSSVSTLDAVFTGTLTAQRQLTFSNPTEGQEVYFYNNDDSVGDHGLQIDLAGASSDNAVLSQGDYAHFKYINSTWFGGVVTT